MPIADGSGMSQRKKPRRASFVVTVAAVAASAVACGGSLGSDGGSGASGGSGGTGGSGGAGGTGGNPPPPPVCPATMPDSADACPSIGLECDYPGYVDECGQNIDYRATCGAEGWSITMIGGGTSCNPPPPWEPCPMEEPAIGNNCWVDPADVCSYPTQCCSNVYQCVNYVWQETGLECNPPALICPDTLPADGQACDPCSYASCTYGSCASTSWVATCSNGAWSVLTNPC